VHSAAFDRRSVAGSIHDSARTAARSSCQLWLDAGECIVPARALPALAAPSPKTEVSALEAGIFEAIPFATPAILDTVDFFAVGLEDLIAAFTGVFFLTAFFTFCRWAGINE